MERLPSSFSSTLLVNETSGFDCPLCFHVFIDPVQCKDGHIFCRGCLLLALNRKPECPMCKTNLTPTTIGANLYVKNAIQESEVYCFTRLEELEAGSKFAAAAAGSLRLDWQVARCQQALQRMRIRWCHVQVRPLWARGHA